ncbi:Rieske 2Fe-2S domain-containing protein [Nocardioides sp. ChNu-153]|uniref:Rieske (2Fe-2S) protein n=1 Tax=unclassified Nocardioides TaxID=2615069 RepID=UPI0024074482|nr:MULTISPECIES: Rieske 2Fe-2S domain-containing protein [unclassified Nocardioides]MDN7122553.1 Rieske 2Fe-2S domain-containing protein [Nocardioides sp. ChNu-153]
MSPRDRSSGTPALGRRGFVRVAAGSAAGAPLLAACGGETEVSAPDGAPGEVIVAAADVPVGGGVIVDDPAVVVTQPQAGTFKAFSSICTHQSCRVTQVEDRAIVCQCHRSLFSIDDGAVLDGPAEEPLPEVAVAVDGTDVTFA